MGIPMLKIRWSGDRLIFNLGILILVRRHHYIETSPLRPAPSGLREPWHWLVWHACIRYSDVIMSAMASQITSVSTVCSTVCSAEDHWPLWGESTGHRWFPFTKGQLREKCFHLMTSSCNSIEGQLQCTCVESVMRKNKTFETSIFPRNNSVGPVGRTTVLYFYRNPFLC